ncbi:MULTISPECIES: LLM class flavin-dependent oxidoreductase [unclassified Nocardioides]|uniref:LLM class flavin-dependent oxidoreductase n=1 Tax=unclassified Nocardioides TaxID=2615069 RepID=UPI0036098BF0
MRVGYTTLFQGNGNPEEDRQVYADNLKLCDLVEPLGFDSLWCTEHHFTEYTMCPDPLQFLSYMAARTQHIDLGSGVVIMPWHDPVRVAGQVAMLDLISGGRFIFGIGRGLGRIEFEGFGVPMDEARGRFLESAKIVLKALETGVLEHDGEYFTVPKRDLRPRNTTSFQGKVYTAAVSPDSIKLQAEIGAGILINPQKDWSDTADDMRTYRKQYREMRGEEAPAPIVTGWMICDKDGKKAKDMAQQYISQYYEMTLQHYELGGRHFGDTSGYEYYRDLSSYIDNKGTSKIIENFIELQIYGTPDECFDRIMAIRDHVGNDGFNVVPFFGSLPYEFAEQQMRLFASEVMPRLKDVPDFDFSKID